MLCVTFWNILCLHVKVETTITFKKRTIKMSLMKKHKSPRWGLVFKIISDFRFYSDITWLKYSFKNHGVAIYDDKCKFSEGHEIFWDDKNHTLSRIRKNKKPALKNFAEFVNSRNCNSGKLHWKLKRRSRREKGNGPAATPASNFKTKWISRARL